MHKPPGYCRIISAYPDHRVIVRSFDQTTRTSHNILPVRLLRDHGSFSPNRQGDYAECGGGMGIPNKERFFFLLGLTEEVGDRLHGIPANT